MITAPPSPAVPNVFTWTKENTPASPHVPAGRPSSTPPCATAESSTSRTPCRRAISRIRGMSAITENMCAGMTAFVRGPIARSTSAGSTTIVTGSMSAKTGVAPRLATVLPSGAQP